MSGQDELVVHRFALDRQQRGLASMKKIRWPLTQSTVRLSSGHVELVQKTVRCNENPVNRVESHRLEPALVRFSLKYFKRTFGGASRP